MYTDRDLEIMALVARLRFLSSDQIIRFFAGLTAHEYIEQLKDKPWAFQVFLRRLHALFSHDLLTRPERQRADLVAFGNASLLYGISRKGARLLKDRGISIDADLDWASQNRVTTPFLLHTVATAEIVLAFELSCRRLGSVELIDHAALLPFFPEETRARPRPFAISAAVRGRPGDLITVIPDRLIALKTEHTASLCAIECDRGTMTIKRYTRKLRGYYEAWRSGLHEKTWGSPSLRVLSIAPSERRLANMIAAQREIASGGSNLFCFSTLERIAEHGALGNAWLTGKSETVSLLGDHAHAHE